MGRTSNSVIHGRTKGRTNGRTDGRTDGQTKGQIRILMKKTEGNRGEKVTTSTTK